MKTQLTLRQVLPQLQESDALNLEAPETKGAQSPWYVRFFIGISAWIAAILLIAFLVIARILTSEGGAIGIGIFFCVIAVALNFANRRNDFLGQLVLALALAGGALLVGGLAVSLKNTIATALCAIVLESALLVLLRDRVHRFLATIFIIAAFVVIIFDLKQYETIHVLLGLLAGIVVVLFWRENDLLTRGMSEILYPVSYGIVIAVFGLLLLPLSIPQTESFPIRWWWLSAALLFVALLFSIVQIARGLEVRMASWKFIILLLVCAALVIPATRMPGIFAALVFLVVGFWRNHRVMVGLAGLFLVIYIGAYYYALEWTLLQKSLALLASGVLLLALRFVLLRSNTAS